MCRIKTLLAYITKQEVYASGADEEDYAQRVAGACSVIILKGCVKSDICIWHYVLDFRTFATLGNNCNTVCNGVGCG
ncbi:MAG: hypothetical protein U0O22_03985 [Acutalibacteraceae bacterium]